LIAQEIHFLSQIACARCDEFKHLIISANFLETLPLAAQTILSFTPPENMTWIVTRISLRSLNPSPTPDSDFRSDDYDYNGLTNGWIAVGGNPVFAENDVVSFALFNRPVLLAFQGGKEVTIIVERDAASLPTEDYQVHVAVNSYLAPPSAYSKLTSNLTDIRQP
jgi:hypothetical protein